MKALIIGGNRFVGRHLAELLLKNGAQVTLLNRGRRGNPFGTRVEQIFCDRQDETALAAVTQGRKWDVVFDFVCFEAKDARGACRVFEDKTKTYVFVSTLSVYDPGPNLTEDLFNPRTYRFNPKKEADSADNYGEAKRQCESIFCQEGKFRVVIPRLPIVCGLDDYTGRLQFHVQGVRKGERIYFPNLEAKITFIEADEAARAIHDLAIKSGLEGPVNCSSPDAVSLAELMQWVELAAGKKAKLATIEITGEPSPFAIKKDFYVDTQKLHAAGVRPRKLRDWLPALIREIGNIERQKAGEEPASE